MDFDKAAALAAIRVAFSTEGSAVPTKHFTEMLASRQISNDDVRHAALLGRIDRIDRTAAGAQTFRLVGPTLDGPAQEEIAVVFRLRNASSAILITCFAPPRRRRRT